MATSITPRHRNQIKCTVTVIAVGYTGGINLYGYVGNDPLNKTDPLGLYDTSCSQADRACNRAITEFENQRKNNLKSRDSAVVASAKAFGDRGQVNGVTVNPLTDQKMNEKHGDRGGSTSTQFVGNKAISTVDIRMSLRGSDMARNAAHEGTHLVQRGALAASYNPDTNRYSAALNLSVLNAEREAFSVGNRVDHRFKSDAEIENFVGHNYRDLGRAIIDPELTE
jgi:uncharacterized protein RhaS with RHS repeats